eukprot:6312280-Amphidinium_carterae.3
MDTRTLGKPREFKSIRSEWRDWSFWAGAQTQKIQLANLSPDCKSLARQIYLALNLQISDDALVKVKGRMRAGIERTTKSEASAVDEA